MRSLVLTLRCPLLACSLLPVACFESGPATRGLPCTEDSACGSLSCDYGVCGGPVRCEAGAGVGDYCYTLEAEIEIGAGIDALAIGDVDFDALPDLVVGNGDAQTVALLRNTGSAQFGPAIVSGPLAVSLDEIVLGSVDGADWSDIVATASTTTLVTIPLRPGASGSGEIGAPQVISSSLVGAARPQIGSFAGDGDALADVAAMVANGFDVFPQSADATFPERVHTEVAASADLQTLGSDANLVYVASTTGNSVVAHSRIAGGQFGATATIDVGPSPSEFVLDDLDNDGFGDVIAVGEGGKIWLTTGRDATFAMPRDPIEVYDLGWTPDTLLAPNLDDDREPELVVAGGRPDGRRDVYLFDNDGQGRPIYGGSLDIDDASSVVVADLDLDGAAEIVIASRERGTIRVARRAVAPPPPGGEESTSGTTGVVDPSFPDPSLTTDPTFPDPSLTTDPTDPSMGETDTGVDPPCDGGFPIGIGCYYIFSYLTTPAPVVDMAVGRVGTNDVGVSLVAATSSTEVWSFFGGLGTYEQPPDDFFPIYYTPEIPSGVAIGELAVGIDDTQEPIVVVTHEAGYSAFSTTFAIADTEHILEGSGRAPVIAPFLRREMMLPTRGIATGGGGLVYTLGPTELLVGDPPIGTTAGNIVSDIDWSPGGDGPVLLVADGGPLRAYAVADGVGPVLAIENYLGSAVDHVVALYGPMQTGALVTAGPGGIDSYAIVDGQTNFVFNDPVTVLADLQAAELDHIEGDDLVALVDIDGVPHLRFYQAFADGSLGVLSDLPVPGITAFTTHQYFLGGISDILIALEPNEDNPLPFILHLVYL